MWASTVIQPRLKAVGLDFNTSVRQRNAPSHSGNVAEMKSSDANCGNSPWVASRPNSPSTQGLSQRAGYPRIFNGEDCSP